MDHKYQKKIWQKKINLFKIKYRTLIKQYIFGFQNQSQNSVFNPICHKIGNCNYNKFKNSSIVIKCK